jgi:DNA-binding response OmpR family regulator
MSNRILVCDDEIHILRAAEIKLKRAGYDVHIAHDGQEAWEAIQAEKPDLLITDFQMPRLDGLSLVQRLREDPNTHDLPVILLTAKGYELSLEELATRWNILHIMGKPFSPRELLEMANKILETEAAKS